jgi:hypothetical protein
VLERAVRRIDKHLRRHGLLDCADPEAHALGTHLGPDALHVADADRSFSYLRASDSARANLLSRVGYAERHRDIVRKFGRFPHRNALLGRTLTPAEIEFLKGPGSSF